MRKHYDFSNLPDTFASDYSPLRITNADKTITIRPASRCKRCQADIKAERYQRLTDEERRKISKKISDQRDKEARRVYNRLYDERKRREAGVEPRNFKDGRNQPPEVFVDATPIAEYLQTMTRTPKEKGGGKTSHTAMGAHQLPSIYEIGHTTGLDVKKLWHIKSGKHKTVDIRIVDQLLTYFDAQHLLVLWYPQTNLERR